MSPWRKTFFSAFAAQVLSISGFCFALPFLPYFLEDLGVRGEADQIWWSGVVMSAAGVTLALFAPLWGIAADRYGRKAMVMRAMFGGTLVVLLMSFTRSVGQLMVCRLLQGALTGTVGASIALVASVSPPRRSGLALGMMQSAVFIGAAIGPLIGGVVADAFGYRVAFRVGSVIIFLGGLLICFGTREEFSPPVRDGNGTGGRFRDVLFSAPFLAAVLVLFAIRLSNTLSNPSFPLIVKEILGPVANLNSVTGSLVAGAAIAGAVSAALLGYFGDSWGHRRVLLLCGALGAVTSLAHVYAHSISYLFWVRILFGLTVAGMIPAANALIHHNTDDAHIGKA